MNFVDIVILLFLAFGALVGFKRGFTKQLVSFVGIFLIIVFSFLLKNPISIFLYKNLPFLNFGGIFKDITVINILVYEIIAFFVIFIILTLIYKILLKVTSILEKIFKWTIILGIPSKILGAILGVAQNIVYTFIVLYIINLPSVAVGFDMVTDSKVANIILDKTPVLNVVCDKTRIVIDEIIKLKEEYETTNNVDGFNQKVLNIMIDNGVITEQNAKSLIKSGKIKDVVIE